IQGTPSWVDGKLGGALDFNGQTYVNAGDAEDLRLTGDITIAFWMRKKAPGGDWQQMVGKGDEKLRSYGCWTGGEGDMVLFQQYNDAAQPVINIKTQRSVQIGAWHHFAGTVQGSQALLYLDGAKCGEGTRTGTPAKSSEPLLLGWGTIHDKFQGCLQDVRIYRRALAAQEVQALFLMGR
ncbi:MAG TPA: LamG domain-containing protein, partial [Planctomycetota bacterium]|nr:LamG domain-containing protein [Planctomycetota bacterium]